MSGNGCLPSDGTTNGVDQAGKLDQKSVAHHLDDATVMLGNQGSYEVFGQCRETLDRSDLVSIHQSTIAGDVGGQDGGKSAPHLAPPERRD